MMEKIILKKNKVGYKILLLKQNKLTRRYKIVGKIGTIEINSKAGIEMIFLNLNIFKKLLAKGVKCSQNVWKIIDPFIYLSQKI